MDRGRGGGHDEAAQPPVDGTSTEPPLEVRVLAIGPIDEHRWLGTGRTSDGLTVEFLTSPAAAEAISDAMAAGTEPLALIDRAQIVRPRSD